ncbi:hypothetical protein [Gordonia iterans]|uniref:hypothetical protein n=1 Tax=Gordonia iterans TaxID=1004901 RepID=UPI00131CBA9B|nr:hypothetical protein [Gordonia iterans]
MSDLPARHRTRPDLCPSLDHPGVTYNAREDRTWCLCGHRTYPGRATTVDQHLACCGGPLTQEIP